MLTQVRWVGQKHLRPVWLHAVVKVHLPKDSWHTWKAPPCLKKTLSFLIRRLTSFTPFQTFDLEIKRWFSFSSCESSHLSAALSLQVHVHLYSASLGQRRYRCDTWAVERRGGKKKRIWERIRKLGKKSHLVVCIQIRIKTAACTRFKSVEMLNNRYENYSFTLGSYLKGAWNDMAHS